MLRLRTRNQLRRLHDEIHPPEFLMPGDVLRRNSGGPAGESFVIAPSFVRGELALGMRVEIRTITVECEHDEELRVHARGRDTGGCQAFDCRIQGLAELHESISPRRPRDTE